MYMKEKWFIYLTKENEYVMDAMAKEELMLRLVLNAKEEEWFKNWQWLDQECILNQMALAMIVKEMAQFSQIKIDAKNAKEIKL